MKRIGLGKTVDTCTSKALSHVSDAAGDVPNGAQNPGKFTGLGQCVNNKLTNYPNTKTPNKNEKPISDMDETTVDSTYKLNICGSFRVVSPDDERLEVVSKKARAILAILALSPNLERQRGWLMDRLWGSREKCQAQASLRHELSTLRKIFGPQESSPIEIRRDCVRLLKDRIHIDALEGDADGELLEGIDIVGEDGFEDWLRTARSATMQPGHRNPLLHRLSGAIAPCHTIKIGLQNVMTAPEDMRASTTGNILLGKITHFFMEFGGFEVVDLRGPDQNIAPCVIPDVYLQLFAQSNDLRVEISLNLLRSSDKSIIWSQVRHIPVTEQGNITDWSLANELSDQIFTKLAAQPGQFSTEPYLAAALAVQGINSMFSLTARNLDLSDKSFALACDLNESSSILAWRAYLGAHWMEEQDSCERADILARTHEYAERALALDPYNGLTLSLLSFVSAFVFRDFEQATELIDRAHMVQSDHVMTHDAQALLLLYKGDLAAARKSAMKAAMLGRFLPHRYAFVTTLCMIDTLNGDYRSGIRNGNLALSLQPKNTGKYYPPTLRYLGACYAQMGQIARARETFGQLARVEPHLSSAIIGTQEYPVPSAQAANVIGNSLLLCDL